MHYRREAERIRMTEVLAEQDSEGTLVSEAPPGELNPEITVEPANADEGESQEEATTSTDAAPDDRPKKKGGFQRRIEKLTEEKYQNQQQLDAMSQQVEMLQQQQIQNQVQQAGEAFPTLDQYGYDEGQYQTAVTAWAQQQEHVKAQAFKQHQKQQAQIAQQQSQAMAMREKVASAVETHPDFLLKVNNPELPNLADVNPAAYEAVVRSDNFADVAYYLANNPAEIYRFSDMDPMSTLREVFKIEQKFGQKPHSSTAPPPPPPSKVSGTSEQAKDPSNMTIEEFMAWRNK